MSTFLAATPAATPPGTEPATSVTNLNPGQTKANMAIVPVGDDGTIRLFNRSGATHLIVDVLGYLERGAPENHQSRAGRAPRRAVPGARHEAALLRQRALGFRHEGGLELENHTAESVNLGGVPVGKQSALIGNFTGTGLTALYPGSAGDELT